MAEQWHEKSPADMAWLTHLTNPPKKVFITHGEPHSAQSLKQKIENQLGFSCTIPSYLQTEELL